MEQSKTFAESKTTVAKLPVLPRCRSRIAANDGLVSRDMFLFCLAMRLASLLISRENLPNHSKRL